MKHFLYVLLFSIWLFPHRLNAQLEKVIVETYYVSDALDATNTTGGILDSGSITYRIYVDMKPGSTLKKIYGDVNHRLMISSTGLFFNNTDRGESFGYNIGNYLDQNTTALDTWLTMGQAGQGNFKNYFGILKIQDRDSSIIGGINNNGGLLINSNTAAGIPLTVADGLDTLGNVADNLQDYGIIDILSGDDSTIFGSIQPNSLFTSNNAGLQCSGLEGVIPDSNQVLIAQLTTKGQIAFELNLEISDIDGNTINYVSNDSILLSGEKLSRYLKYPFQLVCDCPDPAYLEYNSDRDCNIQDSCITLAYLGCMDTNACNYDSKANLHIENLCCYPGYCNNRNIGIVCPGIINSVGFTLFPNPAQSQITLQITPGGNNEVRYSIFDSYGVLLFEKNMGTLSGIATEQINISDYSTGLYLLRVSDGNTSESKIFTKN